MQRRSSGTGGGGWGQPGRKTWKGILQKKMGATAKKSAKGRRGQDPLRSGGGGGGMRFGSGSMMYGQDQEQFHDDLVNMVANAMAQPDAEVDGYTPPPNVPHPRANHSCTHVESNVVLFGGHGGMGYARKPFGDVHVLNLDNQRWQEYTCQGNPPVARCGHTAFAKDACLYLFGGWNSETQFNDVYMLDVENKDWTDLDLSWGFKRWNHACQLVEAIPSWRVFIFGGATDSDGSGRTLGVFDDKIGVLELGDQYTWEEPPLEDASDAARKRDGDGPCPREHTAICYDPEESRMVIFGGWSNKWLDDVWQVNVSSIVGPPYAIIRVEPALGPVTGNEKIKIYGVGFTSTMGDVNVKFANSKHFAECKAVVLDDETIECATPYVGHSIGSDLLSKGSRSVGGKCEVRLSIGVRDFTTTFSNYEFYLNTIAERSMVYGPGVLANGQAKEPTVFVIQSRNDLRENRSSGRDEFVISIKQDGQELYDRNTCFNDLDNGRYEVTYTAGPGEVVVSVALIDENGKERPIRGSPFTATFADIGAKPRANQITGPLTVGFIPSTMKKVEDFAKQTDAGIAIKFKEDDVHGLIKCMNFCQDTWEKEGWLQLKQDEVHEVLALLERENMPNDKANKHLKKIGDHVEQMKFNVREKEKEIAEYIVKQSAVYKEAIVEFEEELKQYHSGLRKEHYYYYKWGLEVAFERIRGVTDDLDTLDERYAELMKIATNFDYPSDLIGSKKIMNTMRDEVAAMKVLWEFEK